MTRKRADDVMHSLPVPLNFKRATGDGSFVAYAATWNTLDLNGERIAKGAFSRSIDEHRAAGSKPKLLWNHEASKPIGRVTALAEDVTGLRIEAELNLDTAAGSEAYASMKAGDVDAMSIGYRVREQDGDTLKDIQLFECSVVAIAANPNARIISVKAIDSKRAVRTTLQDRGWPRGKAIKAANLLGPLMGEESDHYCAYCGDETGERGPLLKGLDADICTSCVEEAAATARKPIEPLLKQIDAATLELKSLRKD